MNPNKIIWCGSEPVETNNEIKIGEEQNHGKKEFGEKDETHTYYFKFTDTNEKYLNLKAWPIDLWLGTLLDLSIAVYKPNNYILERADELTFFTQDDAKLENREMINKASLSEQGCYKIKITSKSGYGSYFFTTEKTEKVNATPTMPAPPHIIPSDISNPIFTDFNLFVTDFNPFVKDFAASILTFLFLS